jgi:hypothetical protein
MVYIYLDFTHENLICPERTGVKAYTFDRRKAVLVRSPGSTPDYPHLIFFIPRGMIRAFWWRGSSEEKNQAQRGDPFFDPRLTHCVNKIKIIKT